MIWKGEVALNGNESTPYSTRPRPRPVYQELAVGFESMRNDEIFSKNDKEHYIITSI